jgi:hemerythrin-like domain-containing protein
MSEPSVTLPFTHEMVVIHRMFRRESSLAPTLVLGVAPRDSAQAQRVVDGITSMLGVLHLHHTGEDLFLWPLLRERAPTQAALLEEMEAQHAQIDPLIERVEALGATWAAEPTTETAGPYADVLIELHRALVVHLDQEESDILPLAQVTVTDEEWGQLAEYTVGNTPQDQLLHLLGAILEDANPQERALMMSAVPPPALEEWAQSGRGAYVESVTAMRGVPPAPL